MEVPRKSGELPTSLQSWDEIVAGRGERRDQSDGAGTVRNAQVRAYDDRALCWNIGNPYKRAYCPVVMCPYLCSSERTGAQAPPGRD